MPIGAAFKASAAKAYYAVGASWWKGHLPHCYETGRMRRVHLRGRENILKRLLIHIAGFNLSLVLRSMTGNMLRGLQDLAIAYFFTLLALANQIWRPLDAAVNFMPHKSVSSGYLASVISNVKIGVSATGCHENIHVTLID